MLAWCIVTTREGDTLAIYKVGRLARSLKDLLNLLDMLDTKGVFFKSSRGVKTGRARAMSPSEEAECVRKFHLGNYTKSGLARMYGCHISSVKRALARRALEV